LILGKEENFRSGSQGYESWALALGSGLHALLEAPMTPENSKGFTGSPILKRRSSGASLN